MFKLVSLFHPAKQLVRKRKLVQYSKIEPSLAIYLVRWNPICVADFHCGYRTNSG